MTRDFPQKTEDQSPIAEFSAKTRSQNLDRMGREDFDVAVIGGGITGAGVALDSATRGFKTLLVEKGDFGSGTSSRSSKLIHGGLRYLEQMQFGLVQEALHERAVLRRIAPNLCEPLRFLIPVYERGIQSPLGSSKLKLRLGLSLYDLLAGKENIGTHSWISVAEASRLAPGLNSEGLRGCFVYYDCLTDDTRLVIEVIKAAAARGAVISNYAELRQMKIAGGKIESLEIYDVQSQREVTARASVIVNAAGVWSNQVSQLTHEDPSARLRPSKGIHIVVPAEKVRVNSAVLIPSLGENRFLFVIPWHGRTLIGTTDSDYDGDLDNPIANSDEVAHVVRSANWSFPSSNLKKEDVISSFAGLRPLVAGDGKATSDLSRKEQILEDKFGMISIIGGKLTTYRRIAEKAVEVVESRLGSRKSGRESTGNIRLEDGLTTELSGEGLSLSSDVLKNLENTYGGSCSGVLELVRLNPDLRAPLAEGLPYIEAEVVYAARHEMATTAEDFLFRRTRIALLDRAYESCAKRVKELIAEAGRRE